MRASGSAKKESRKFSQEMVNGGLITQEQLAVAEVTRNNFGHDILFILIQKGFIQEKEALDFFAQRFGFEEVDLKDFTIDHNLLRWVPYRLAQRFTLIPLSLSEGVLRLAIADPSNIELVEPELHSEDLKFHFVLAPRQPIEKAIRDHYQVHAIPKGQTSHVEVITEGNRPQPLKDASLEELATSLGTVEIVNSILEKAHQERASDIHIEPQELFLRVRLRIDGSLEEGMILPNRLHLPVISRMKILSGMNIAEKRSPQDGRFRVKIHGEVLDCRTSSYPTVHGEKMVIRLLTKESLKRLEQLGMSEEDREVFRSCISKPHGLILVTGPTGSGKSTTLYAALQILNSTDRNIVSIEDPVENEISGVNQAQVNLKANVTFASALRSMLRQDPDIIMVGEIRDSETAEMALRAAMTGHLVLSTLHTNTAVGAIPRLINLGLAPYLLSSSLVAVLGQRLVRKICTSCRSEILDEKGEGTALDLPPQSRLYRAQGCEKCRWTGFTSRVGLFELLPIQGNLPSLIEKRAPEEAILAEARQLGFKAMVEDGRSKVLQGVTTVSEVLKVTTEEGVLDEGKTLPSL